MTPTPIPEEFKEQEFKIWAQNYAQEYAKNNFTVLNYESNYALLLDVTYNALIAAYRLLSARGLRWVKVSKQNPDKTGRYYVKYSGDISGEQREGLFYFNVNWSEGPYKVEYWLLDESPAPTT